MRAYVSLSLVVAAIIVMAVGCSVPQATPSSGTEDAIAVTQEEAKTASNNVVSGWSSWGCDWYNTHRGRAPQGPHENIAHRMTGVGMSIHSDPMTVGQPGEEDIVYVTTTGGTLARIDWNQYGNLEVTQYGGPGLPCNNNASTPSMSNYGRVHYALTGGYLVTFDTNTLTFGPHYSLGAPLSNRFTSPEIGKIDGPNDNSPIVYVQGGDGFYVTSTDSDNYDDYWSFVHGVNCCGLFNDPCNGAAQFVVLQENLLGCTVINCYRARARQDLPLEWRMYSVPLEGAMVQKSVTMIDVDPFFWPGDCIVVCDNAMYYLAKDPEQDVHDLPWRLIPFDCEPIQPELGAYVSSAALVFTHGGWYAYVLQLEYVQGPEPYHDLRLVVYSVNPVTKQMAYFWNSDALDYAGSGHTTPAVDISGYAYITATIPDPFQPPGQPPMTANRFLVYDPWGGDDDPEFVYPIYGSDIQSSPSIGSDGRVYVTTDVGTVHAFYEP